MGRAECCSAGTPQTSRVPVGRCLAPMDISNQGQRRCGLPVAMSGTLRELVSDTRSCSTQPWIGREATDNCVVTPGLGPVEEIPRTIQLMRRVRGGWVRLATVVLVVTTAIATPQTALAAMAATISSDHARPGDSLLLLTDDFSGSWNYDGLSEENHQKIFLAPTSTVNGDACGGAGTQSVGRLEWRGNAAGLAFVAPNLPVGDYWLFMQTNGACWRLAGETGASFAVLVLSIGSISADNQDVAAQWTVDSLPALPGSKPQPPRISTPPRPAVPLWLEIFGACALVLLIISVVVMKARTDNPAREVPDR
jgi:hypothetical protein